MAVSLTSMMMIMTDGGLFDCELCYVEGPFFRVVRWIGDIILYFVRSPSVGSDRNIMPFIISGRGPHMRLIVFGMIVFLCPWGSWSVIGSMEPVAWPLAF